MNRQPITHSPIWVTWWRGGISLVDRRKVFLFSWGALSTMVGFCLVYVPVCKWGTWGDRAWAVEGHVVPVPFQPMTLS